MYYVHFYTKAVIKHNFEYFFLMEEKVNESESARKALVSTAMLP